ncbi:MAG: 50S ribosomal protein L11 methyltransferase [Balneolaceae bacterium]|nr:50S ribosomal protein L11 methyltransferase [Balneolaceae bacterium]
MDYLRVYLSIPDEFQELLIAELFDMDFEGFEEEEHRIIASIPAKDFNDYKREEIERILMHYGDGAYLEKEELVAPQNWNANWEQSIEPQTIGKFYVRPTWGEAYHGDEFIELLIDPKMAFGTGYHATTRLLLEWIPEVVKGGEDVLDAGTGTGILAIAALKAGAEQAFGFDIDEWSEENARENMELNNIEKFDVKLGSTETIPEGKEYDLILANINRNALMELIPVLNTYLKPGGKLLLSGLLEADESTILKITDKQLLTHVSTRQQKEWIAILLRK